jgi:hypothetical protein
MIFQRGSRTSGISPAGGSLPKTGSLSVTNRLSGIPTAAASDADTLTFM